MNRKIKLENLRQIESELRQRSIARRAGLIK